MRGVGFTDWVVRTSGNDKTGPSWLSDLKTAPRSALPEPNAGSWSSFVTQGAIDSRSARAEFVNNAGANLGRLWTRIGETVGYPISEGIEAFEPMAKALSFERFSNVPGFDIVGNVNWQGALSGLIAGQPIGEVMAGVLVEINKQAVTNITSSIPIAGVLFELTDVYMRWVSGDLDPPSPAAMCSQIESAEISATADQRAAQAVIDAFGLDDPIRGPDLTSLFMPPGPFFRLFHVNYRGLAGELSSPACLPAWGTSPDFEALGWDYGVGYVPGTSSIHVGFQAGGYSFSAEPFTSGWVDPGAFLPTAASYLSQIWVQIQAPGPLMYCVEANKVADAWVEYLIEALINIPLYDWGGEWRRGIALWNALAAKVGLAPFDTWYERSPAGLLERKPAANAPLGDLTPMEKFRAIAETSTAVQSMRRLHALQGQNLRSRVMGYITNDFVGLRDQFDQGNGVFVRNETATLLAQSGARCGLDRGNIVDPVLASVVATCPPGTKYTTSAQSYATLPLAPAPSDATPPTIWTPQGQIAAPEVPDTGSTGAALAALAGVAGLLWILRR